MACKRPLMISHQSISCGSRFKFNLIELAHSNKRVAYTKDDKKFIVITYHLHSSLHCLAFELSFRDCQRLIIIFYLIFHFDFVSIQASLKCVYKASLLYDMCLWTMLVIINDDNDFLFKGSD